MAIEEGVTQAELIKYYLEEQSFGVHISLNSESFLEKVIGFKADPTAIDIPPPNS